MYGAKKTKKEIWVVFQPHTYTRTKAKLHEFADALAAADHVIVTDIYAAREQNDVGVTSEDLKKEIENLGCDVYYIPDFEDVKNFLHNSAKPGDTVITMGAGDVTKISDMLVE